VTNQGAAMAKNVVVTDSLPEFLDIIDVTTTRGVAEVAGQTVVVSIGSVAPGEVITIHIRARVNEVAQPPAGRNSATLTTSSSGDDPTNNTATVEFGILPSCTTPTPQLAYLLPVAAPQRLPNTGSDTGQSGSLTSLLLLSLLVLAAGALLRRRSAADS
jgi:MYXO-CTERM domain-containing protein